jgi:hypothetical protein
VFGAYDIVLGEGEQVLGGGGVFAGGVVQGEGGRGVGCGLLERRRRQVAAGAYRLRQHSAPVVTLAAMDALAGADWLANLGYGADVVCSTSPDLLFRACQARRGQGRPEDPQWILDRAFPLDRATPPPSGSAGSPRGSGARTPSAPVWRLSVAVRQVGDGGGSSPGGGVSLPTPVITSRARRDNATPSASVRHGQRPVPYSRSPTDRNVTHPLMDS